MAKKFFVWADANCNGENIDWIELTGEMFIKFVRNPANSKRRFITLSDPISYEADVIVIEATEEKYREWYKDNQHSLYLAREGKEIREDSLEYLLDFPSFDIASSFDFVEEVEDKFEIEKLAEAIKMLSDKEQIILKMNMDFLETRVSIAVLSEKYGVSRATYFRKLPQIYEIIQKIMRL